MSRPFRRFRSALLAGAFLSTAVAVSVAVPASGACGDPAPSGRIAYTLSEACVDHIWSMSADGTMQLNLTNGNGTESEPAWSADGSKIAYTAWDGTNSQIWSMDFDGANRVQITNDPWRHSSPSWSPDGERIVFVSTRTGPPELEIIGKDGSDPVNLTSFGANVLSPAWSPDGTRIAFASTQNGPVDIYVIGVDFPSIVRLTNSGDLENDPAWSPDGTRIAMSVIEDSGPSSVIYLIDSADGANRTPLTGNSCVEESHPAWSPDGLRLAYLSMNSGTTEIYTIGADGSGVTRLTTSEVNVWTGSPSWAPAYSRPVVTTPASTVADAGATGKSLTPAFAC